MKRFTSTEGSRSTWLEFPAVLPHLAIKRQSLRFFVTAAATTSTDNRSSRSSNNINRQQKQQKQQQQNRNSRSTRSSRRSSSSSSRERELSLVSNYIDGRKWNCVGIWSSKLVPKHVECWNLFLLLLLIHVQKGLTYIPLYTVISVDVIIVRVCTLKGTLTMTKKSWYQKLVITASAWANGTEYFRVLFELDLILIWLDLV